MNVNKALMGYCMLGMLYLSTQGRIHIQITKVYRLYDRLQIIKILQEWASPHHIIMDVFIYQWNL